MSYLSHLAALRAHGEWADQQLLGIARLAHVPLAIRELAHVRGAQEIWLSRIERRVPTLAIWPEMSIDQLATAGATVDAAWRGCFATFTEDSLARAISYRSIAGDPFTTPLGEILAHLFMHGHYHRGKANAALSAAGVAPVSVDYILWQRAHNAPDV